MTSVGKADIEAARDLWKKDTSNGEAFQSYGDAAACYLVSPLFQKTGCHWFCDSENFEYATISLLTFTYVDNGDQRVEKLRSTYRSYLTHQLNVCWKCVLKYHESRTNFVDILRGFNLDADRVKEFCDILSSFDLSRTRELVITAGVTECFPSTSNDLTALAEALSILDIIGLELDKGLQDQLVGHILKHLDEIIVLTGDYLFPGLVYLLFSDSPPIQTSSETVLFSVAYQHLLSSSWGKPQTRALLNALSKKTSIVADIDFSWFLLAKLTDYAHFDDDTIEKLSDLTSQRFSPSIGPGGFFWISKLSLKQRRLPEPGIMDQIFRKMDVLFEQGLKPSSTPESARVHAAYSRLGNKAWRNWIDSFQKIIVSAPDSRRNQECAKQFVNWGLNHSDDLEIALATLNIVGTSLRMEYKTQIPVSSSVDITLRTGMFNALNERGDCFVESLRTVISSPNQHATSAISASVVTSLIQFSVLGLLSEFPELRIETDLSRSKKFAWELVCSDRILLERCEKLAEALVIGASFVPYLDQRSATYKSISDFFRTVSVLYTRDELMSIFKNTDAETVLLLACQGMDNGLVETAKNIFARLYADEENTFDLAVARFFESQPGTAVAVIVKISKVALSFGEFQTLPGLVKMLRLVFDVLYDSEEGVIDDVVTKLNSTSNRVLDLWNVTWRIMTLSFGRLRSWSKSPEFSISLLREYISDCLELCLTLLSYFTRVEATMPAAANGLNRGNDLVEEPVKTLESMVPLLKLRDESQLDSSFRIYKGLIELINKYAVKVPVSLLDYFRALAQSQTLLTSDKYAELLAITGSFSDEEMSSLIRDLKGTSTKAFTPGTNITRPVIPPNQATTVVAQSRGSELGKHDAARQRTMDNFFTKVPRLVQEPPSRLTSHGVTPSTPKVLSAMEQIRLQLASQQAHLAGSGTLEPPKAPVEIHPARPAGFNRRRQDEATGKTQGTSLDRKKRFDREGRVDGDERDEDEDEDDDDDEDEDAGILVALGRKTRNINNSSRIAPGLANRSLRAPTLTESEQGVRRMMARMSVSPAELHKAILSWEYFLSSSQPTGFIKSSSSVPSVFKDVEEYTKVMEPLLHLEAWQSIQRAREENNDVVMKIEIGKRVNTDDFIDVYASMEAKDSGGFTVGDSDLVLIAYDPSSNNMARRITKDMLHCLAVVKEGSLKTRRGQRYTDLQLRTYRPGELSPFMAQGRRLYMQRVCSIITVEREYTALKSLPYYELKDSILQGRANQPTSKIAAQPDGGGSAKLQGLNASQAQAVETAITKQGFNLIQGPPGTGKTKTILGIVAKYFFGVSENQKKRLLICAPSNAAVDEIVSRLKAGVRVGAARHFTPRIVRLGRKEVINPQAREFSLEMLIQKSVSSIASAPDEELRHKLTKLTSERTELEERLRRRDSQGLDQDGVLQLHDQLELCTKRIQEYSKLLSQQRRQLKEDRIRKEAEYKRLQSEYLSNAQVICCTLSGAAHAMLFSLQLTFPTVIIDEAAQSVELSALIPLKYGCKQCIMVGDPHQLPPTVLSQEAARLKYEQSMFVRFYERAPESMTLLDTQFRMHPMISRFPSHEFYKDKLKDGTDMAIKTSRPWHKDTILSPFRFIEVAHGTEDRPGTMSLRNRAEARVVVDLISYLMKSYPNIDFTSKIGVIAPYKAQQSYICRLIRDEFGAKVESTIDVATVDGYQGQEKEIIIMSCVRAQKDRDGIGFLADVRRMNVAFTRAQASLWIVGNRESLVKNKVWSRLIDYSQYIGMFSKFDQREKGFRNAIKLTPPKLELASKHAWLRPVHGGQENCSGEMPKKRIKLIGTQHVSSETQEAGTSEASRRRDAAVNMKNVSEGEPETQRGQGFLNASEESLPSVNVRKEPRQDVSTDTDYDSHKKSASTSGPSLESKRERKITLESGLQKPDTKSGPDQVSATTGDPKPHPEQLSASGPSEHAGRAGKQRSFDPTARAGHERRRKPQLFVPNRRKLEHKR